MIDDPKEDGTEAKPIEQEGQENQNIRPSDPNPPVPVPEPTPAIWPAPTPQRR